MAIDETKELNRADVNKDGVINSLDQQIVARYIGQHSDYYVPPQPTYTADLYVNGAKVTGPVTVQEAYAIECKTNAPGDVRIQFRRNGIAFHSVNNPPYENDAPYDQANVKFGAGTYTLQAFVFPQAGSVALAQTPAISVTESGTPPPPPPPPPPTGDGIVVEMIRSVDGTPNEALVPGVGTNWDFYAHGCIQKGNPGSSRGVSLWAIFSDLNNTSVTVETRNPHLYALDSSNNWHEVSGVGFKGSQLHPTEPCNGQPNGDMGSGPTFTKSNPSNGAQFWSWQANLPANCIGIVAYYEVRQVSGSSLVCAGSDCWPVPGSSSGNQGLCVGRFIKPTADWRVVACSSVTKEVLAAKPPPL